MDETKINMVGINGLIGLNPEFSDDKLLFRLECIESGKPDSKALGQAPSEMVIRFAWATSATEAIKKIEKWYGLLVGSRRRDLLAIITVGPTDLRRSQICDVEVERSVLEELQNSGLVTEN